MNTAKIIAHIKKYMTAKGFEFNNGTIENMYLSLKSKPFLILSGSDGSGKHTLARLFCESINITSENGRFKYVCPGGALDKFSNHIGYIDTIGNFCPGEVFEFVIKALKDTENPYVLYVSDLDFVNSDEYLREIFKIMDTARISNDKIISEPIFSESIFKSDKEKELYGNITFPENLYIICSVCRSDESYCVSSKIKDRANIMEILAENMEFLPKKDTDCKILTDVKNDFLKSEFLNSDNLVKNDYSDTVIKNLREINKLLRYYENEFGYRTRNEIVTYLMVNSKYKLLSNDDAFDNCLVQRILTKIEGSDQGLKSILSLLFKQCVTKGVGDYYANSLKMYRALSYPDCRYKKSAEKIMLMTRRFETSGYCSF